MHTCTPNHYQLLTATVQSAHGAYRSSRSARRFLHSLFQDSSGQVTGSFEQKSVKNRWGPCVSKTRISAPGKNGYNGFCASCMLWRTAVAAVAVAVLTVTECNGCDMASPASSSAHSSACWPVFACMQCMVCTASVVF
jgi:hypothetical protein